MPKKLKVSPNERVDIPDFLRAANEYTSETAAFEAQKLLLGDRAHLIEGFRVRIVNSSGNPARILAYNGNAKNSDGTHLHNEADPVYVQEVSITGATTTFYIEVVFLEADDDEDSRAFWDPTVDNADPIPDGQEFDAPVVTRTTPTWRIVNPVSTTGFDYDALTNPDSVKIPLVALTTNVTNEVLTGGANPGLVVVYPASVTEIDFTATDTKVKVSDARLFSDGADNAITIDPDNVTTAGTTLTTVSGVDLANNILTIPLLGVAFPAGTVVRATGRTDEYVQERPAGLVPGDPATAGHPDNASRLFQGSEIRGSGVQVDKEDANERSDLNIKNHKDQIDFLAAQLREMKWGSSRVGDDGIEATRVPPTTFDLVNDSPRYYSKTRSIQGAGSYTYTVGDGVNSYGDFNAADETAINAAIQAASEGDTIFIKAGAYVTANPILVDKSLTFIGDGFNTQIATITAGVVVFSVSGASQLGFRNLLINANNNVTSAIVVTDALTFTLTVDDCLVFGRIDPGTASMLLYRVANCVVTSALASSLLLGNAAGISSQRVVVENNSLVTGEEDSTVISLLSVDNFSWQNNVWIDSSSSATLGGVAIELLASSAVGVGQIRNTKIGGAGVTCPRLVFCAAGFGADNLVIDGVELDDPGVMDSDGGETILGFIKVDTFVNLEIRNIFVTSDILSSAAKYQNTVFLALGGLYTASAGTTAPKNCVLENIVLDYAISTTPGSGILVGSLIPSSIAQNTTMRNVHISNAQLAGKFQAVGSTVIEQCSVDGGGLNSGSIVGYLISNTAPLITDRISCAIRDCSFENIKFTNGSTISGVWVVGTTFNPIDLTVENCLFSVLGDATAAVTNAVYGINVTSGNLDRLTVQNNAFTTMFGPGACNIKPVFVGAEATSILSQHNVVGNDLFVIGTGANICEGIGFNPTSGTGTTLTNVTIKDNSITSMSTSSPGNYGIILRVPAGAVTNANISDNYLSGIGNALPTVFGSAVAVLASSVDGLKIDHNQCYFTGTNGVGAPILLSLADPSTGGTGDSVSITHNTVKTFTGNETTAGVIVLGAAGAVPGSFTTFTHTVVSNNYVEINHDAGTFETCLFVGGYLQHCTFNDNTLRHLNPGTSSLMMVVTGVDVAESDFVTMRGNKLEMPAFSSANNLPNISISALKQFTLNDNIIDVENSNAALGVILQFIDCNNGTITGNFIRGPNLTTKTIEFFGGANFFIYGSGNNFGGSSNPLIVGTSAAASIVVTEGDAVTVGAVASNLTN